MGSRLKDLVVAGAASATGVALVAAMLFSYAFAELLGQRPERRRKRTA